MAFDTVNARSSVLRFRKPYIFPVIWASGSLAQEESQMALHEYAGILAIGPGGVLVNYLATVTAIGGYEATISI